MSIGIATDTDGIHSAATLARLADEAMYAAKRGGRARWAAQPARIGHLSRANSLGNFRK